MRILVIPDLFPRFDGDVRGVFLLDWIKSVESECEITVLAINSHAETANIRKEVLSAKVQVLHLDLPRKSGLIAKALYYRRYFREGVNAVIKEGSFDLIHTHGAILSGTIADKLATRWKVPFLVTEHTGPFSTISAVSWKLRWARRILEKAAHVLVVSQHLADEMHQAGIQPKSCIVTGNPVDTQLFSLIESQTSTMLFLSRLDEFKGGLRTLKAFHKIQANHPDWHLRIVGSGEEESVIQSYLEENQLGEKVVFTPAISKPEIAPLFQDEQPAFLIFPSRHESFGLVAAEALSSGIPVLGTDRTGPVDFLDEKNSICVNPDSIPEISAAMEKMMTTSHDFDRKAIRQNIEASYGFSSFGQKLLNIYRSAQ